MKTTAVQPISEIGKELRGDMAEKAFNNLIKSQKLKSEEIDRVQAGANEKILRLHWKMGTELLDTIFKGGNTRGIGRYAEYTGLSETRIRRALSFAKSYTEEKLALAIEQGLHMGAIDSLLRIGDEKKRDELGAEIADKELTTRETRQLVKDAIAEDAEIEKPTSAKRSKEEQTQKHLEITNPIKAVPKCMSRLKAFTDSCTNLVESFANLDSALRANSNVRKGLLSEMEELKEAVSSNRELFKDMAEALDERIKEAKSIRGK